MSYSHWRVGDAAKALVDARRSRTTTTNPIDEWEKCVDVVIEKLYMANGGTPSAWVRRIDGVAGAFEVALWRLICDPELFLSRCHRTAPSMLTTGALET